MGVILKNGCNGLTEAGALQIVEIIVIFQLTISSKRGKIARQIKRFVPDMGRMEEK